MMTKDKLEKILKNTFASEYIFVADDSYRHAGHAEAITSGGKHFSIVIVSQEFDKRSLVQRHQMVYGALQGAMGQAIHALAIKAWTPEEYQKQHQKDGSA